MTLLHPETQSEESGVASPGIWGGQNV